MRAADLFEHFALNGSSRKPAKLGNEFPHRPMTPQIPIPCDVGSQVALQPRGVVPMGAGWIARSPFFPSWIRCCSVDEPFAAPSSAQGQMGIKPDIGFREFCEFIPPPHLRPLDRDLGAHIARRWLSGGRDLRLVGSVFDAATDSVSNA